MIRFAKPPLVAAAVCALLVASLAGCELPIDKAASPADYLPDDPEPTLSDDLPPPRSGSIEVTLTWTTPKAPDAIGAGTDLDLHVLHPEGEDWFEEEWDGSPYNTEPEWAYGGGLTAVDTEGQGSETFGISGPDVGRYIIAVHHADDDGLGRSEATLQIRVDGELLLETKPVSLDQGWIWEAAVIDYELGTVEPVETHRGDAVMHPISQPLD